MKRLLSTAIVLGVTGLVAVVAAQQPAGGMMGPQAGMRQGMGPGGPGGPGAPMAALNLTQEQRQQLQAIQQAHQQANQDQARQLRDLNDQLRAALFGDNPDQAVEIAKQVGQLEAQLLPSRVAMQAEIVKLLTPDQKKIAMELNLFGPNGMGGPGGPGMRARGPAPAKK
jgi:Spy/CpxP family protein refolding chaperone